jgi:hypothetical protein
MTKTASKNLANGIKLINLEKALKIQNELTTDESHVKYFEILEEISEVRSEQKNLLLILNEEKQNSIEVA